MQQKAAERKRPLPLAVAYARVHFACIWSVDGSVLDTLLKKTSFLQEAAKPVLAGKITTVVDIVTQVPAHIWYKENPQAHDQTSWGLIFEVLLAGTLLLLDNGYIDYAIFDRLTDKDVAFVTRAKTNASCMVVHILHKTEDVRVLLIQLGSKQKRCQHKMRLDRVCFRAR